VTVLAAIRFVEAAAVAEAAAGFARQLGQPLHLVHVLPAEAVQVPGDAARAFIRIALETLARRLGTDGLPVTSVVASGETHLELLSVAAQAHASLLVVGLPPAEAGRGRGGTVERLSRDCPVPLLAVPTEEPFASWGPERPLRVVMGVDTSRPTRAAAAFVERLAQRGPVELTAVRIVYPLYDARRLGLPLPMDYGELGPELEAALRREVEDVLQGVRRAARSTRIELHPSIGRAADPLVAQAMESGADVLALGTHHRRALGRLWSVSRQALRLRRMAILAVPATETTREEARGFHTVVAATDFSPLGDEAVALARAAVQAGGTLHLVHVAQTKPSVEEEAALSARLRSLVAEGADGVDVQVEVRVRNQPPGSDEASCILQSAERASADLVCVGAGGRSVLRLSLLGSVATRLLAKSSRPVLLARPSE
jgi:nucleotide-binding universal stress UspA family protein